MNIIKAGKQNNINFAHPIQPNDKGQSVIFIHGFANDPDDAIKAYSSMAPYYKTKDYNVFGFIWPSNGYVGARSYLSDFRRARKAKHALRSAIAAIKGAMPEGHKIVIQCHSMGSVVAMETLAIIESGLIHRIIIHGGDATRKLFKKRRKYGKHFNKINGVLSLYSEHDRVLSTVAKLFRPVCRVGEKEFPKRVPDEWKSVSAEKVSGNTIRHNSYKSAQLVLTFSSTWGKK